MILPRNSIFVFDLDDTLLMSGTYNRYSDIEPDNYLNLLLFKLKCKCSKISNAPLNKDFTLS